ncbi:putative reverse transcriptase domain-containing protein [Tanacetum coccineum]
MVGCTIASRPCIMCMQYDNYVKLDEHKNSSIIQRRVNLLIRSRCVPIHDCISRQFLFDELRDGAMTRLLHNSRVSRYESRIENRLRDVVRWGVSYQIDVRSKESLEYTLARNIRRWPRMIVHTVRAEMRIEEERDLLTEQERYGDSQGNHGLVECLLRMVPRPVEAGARVDTLETLVAVSQTLVIDCSYVCSQLSRAYGLLPTSRQKMIPKRRTTRLNPGATPTPITDTHTTTSITNAQIQAMINEGVTAALAARDATRNCDDSHTSGTGARRPVQVARECTYPNFLKCQPLNFKGTEGVVKFATCTLQGNALTWWNSYVKTTTPEAAHAMPWRILKKMMTDKYCPMGEIKKLEFEMWNLKVKGNDVVTYSQLFKELALMCDRMFPEESDKIEKYIGGLPHMIHGSVMATKPKTMEDAIEFATELMDKKISTFAERQAENKRKLDNNNQAQQQLPKRQNVVQAYAARTGERKEYAGTLPQCNKCKFHHNGPCTVKCANCKRVGHLTRDCWSYAATNNQRTLTCYECGNQWHYRSDCPKLKNGNQARDDFVVRHIMRTQALEAGGRVDTLEDTGSSS